jgi:hypothetical protein
LKAPSVDDQLQSKSKRSAADRPLPTPATSRTVTAKKTRANKVVTARLDGPRSKEKRLGLGLVLGSIGAWDQLGRPLVDFPGNPTPRFLLARSTVPLNGAAPGKEVALMFVEGDLLRPVITGLLEAPPRADGRPALAELDGERFVFTADKEIVLRCGDASITLTKAGKVIIRGAYVLSRSSGVNRIKGGSVQIN